MLYEPMLDSSCRRLLNRCGCLPPAALIPERHVELLEQRVALGVGTGGCHNRNLQASQLVHLVVLDLGKHDLLSEANAVIATPVERPAADATEVANTGQRHVDQPVEELIHACAAQGDHG